MQDVEIILDDNPGSIAKMGEALAKDKISVEGGGTWIVNEIGVSHFLFKDGTKAKESLENLGIKVASVNDVLVQKLQQDVPGQLGLLTRRMSDAGINIEVLYSDHDNQMILVVDDMEKGKVVSELWKKEFKL